MPGARRRTPSQTKIAKRRKAKKLTQKELAERAGLSLRTVQRIERGEVDNAPLRYLVNISWVLGCRLSDVLEEEWLRWKVWGPGAPQSPFDR